MTFDEFRRLPDDPLQHEVVGGEHLAWPSPDIRHNRVKMELMLALHSQLDSAPSLLLLPGPLDLKLSEQDVVRPDLVVVEDLDGSILEGEWLERRPELVIEVLTVEGIERDRQMKLPLYERVGVPETWIVDPAICVVDQYVLREGRYAQEGLWSDRIRCRVLPELRIDLDDLWRRVAYRAEGSGSA